MNKFHYAIASLVTAVWTIVYLSDVYRDDFNAPPEVTGVLLAIVTAMFGPSVINKWKNGGDDK